MRVGTRCWYARSPYSRGSSRTLQLLSNGSCCWAEGDELSEHFEIRSPISGCVLRVLRESMTAVEPGAPLMELGDPTDLEVVIDVLSTDAVKISPGATVIHDRWGGEDPLLGTVRLVVRNPDGPTSETAASADTGDPNLPHPDMSGLVRFGLATPSARFSLQAVRMLVTSLAASGSSRCVLTATRWTNASRSACS